jgi:m7GpppX diphosphatase
MIYPATEMLIAKYSRQQSYSVRETADVYNKITKTYVNSLDTAHVEWMNNVLDDKKETELCVFQNDHFKLQKDYKFNEGDLKTLYCLAIPKQAREKSLKTIRDLKGDDLPMLKSMVAECYKAIEHKFGVPQHKIYAFFHYLPTYYLMHVHFTHVDNSNRDAREQISLEVAISNLEMNAEYYQKCTLQYSVGEKHDLCKALMTAGILKEYVEPIELEVEGETEEVSTFRGSQSNLEELKENTEATKKPSGKVSHDEDSLEIGDETN